MNTVIEIERKFLVNSLPPLTAPGKGTKIQQGYLSQSEESEVRLRRAGKKCTLTVKQGKGLERKAHTTRISQKQFETLWPAVLHKIEKQRQVLKHGSYRIEIDEFSGDLKGLMLAEVEFSDRKTADTFEPPPWLGPEVTGDERFTNSSLATYRHPDSQISTGPPLSSGTGLPVSEVPPEPAPLPDDIASAMEDAKHAVGAIPIVGNNGDSKVVLITTRNNNRWIFPKGNPEPDMADPEVALMEAAEEAGVKGEINGLPQAVYYWKGFSRYKIAYYPMKVSEILKNWDEKKQRQRKVLSFDEAVELVENRSLKQALTLLEQKYTGSNLV
ncbi:MAG: NUDIX domain-containing protein [Spirochaetales bacterium]|nr:NUDIX domain-containing protein [Spirochaetales bacterium]MCF7938544.1 NUDIX domain-containing protein [Spirochaetales bacterium]